MGHGRALLGLKKKDKFLPVAEKVINDGLNVRQLEKLVQQLNDNVSRETKKPKEEKMYLSVKLKVHCEKDLARQYPSKIKEKGRIEIEFFSDEDLERILELLDKNND